MLDTFEAQPSEQEGIDSQVADTSWVSEPVVAEVQ